MRLTEWLILNVPDTINNEDPAIHIIIGGNSTIDCKLAIGTAQQFWGNQCNEYFIGEFSYINIDNLIAQFKIAYS